jgi:mannose-6-phosphate isomerase-like protein (cupin superfamily)
VKEEAMKIVHGDTLEWRRGLEYRGGTFHFRNLAEGEEGSVDNFKLSVGRSSADFYSPRHRHNFEQIRFVLDGELSFGRDGTLSAGMIGYFPEGVHYGPQTQHHESLAIVLQCGGASGSGYPSRNEVKTAMDALEASGSFTDGVFRRREGVPGKKNMDGFQAIWEHINQRPMLYPKGRYPAPIMMDPKNYAWTAVESSGGVEEKLLGVFTERRTEARFLHLDAGSSYYAKGRGVYYVVSGAGTATDNDYRAMSTIYLKKGERTMIKATAETQIFLFGLPDLTGMKLGHLSGTAAPDEPETAEAAE